MQASAQILQFSGDGGGCPEVRGIKAGDGAGVSREGGERQVRSDAGVRGREGGDDARVRDWGDGAGVGDGGDDGQEEGRFEEVGAPGETLTAANVCSLAAQDARGNVRATAGGKGGRPEAKETYSEAKEAYSDGERDTEHTHTVQVAPHHVDDVTHIVCEDMPRNVLAKETYSKAKEAYSDMPCIRLAKGTCSDGKRDTEDMPRDVFEDLTCNGCPDAAPLPSARRPALPALCTAAAAPRAAGLPPKAPGRGRSADGTTPVPKRSRSASRGVEVFVCLSVCP